MPDTTPEDVRSILSNASAAPADTEATHNASQAVSDGGSTATLPATDQQSAAPPSFSFLDYAKSQGFDLGEGVDNDQAAADAFLGNWRQMQAYLAQQQMQAQQPAETPQTPAAPKEEEWTLDGHIAKHWGVPKKDPAWDTLIASKAIVRDPETGQYVPRPDMNAWMTVNPAVLQAINEYEAAYANRARQFLSDPIREMHDALVEVFDRRYAKPTDVDGRFESQQVEQVAASFERQHADWLATPDGAKFLNLVAAFRATQPPMEALKSALSYISPPEKAAAPVPQSTPAEAAPATPPAPTPEQISAQKQASFLQDAKQRASHSQSGGSAPPAPEDTGPMSGDEVRTLLKRAHRAKAAAGS